MPGEYVRFGTLIRVSFLQFLGNHAACDSALRFRRRFATQASARMLAA